MKHIALLLLVANTAFALTVGVESPHGAPRLVVDGQPVRARMFWGGPGAAPIRITNDWQEIGFEFTAAASATNGTLHLRFEDAPGEVEISGIKATGLDISRWHVWPPSGTGLVQRAGSALRVKLSRQPEGFHLYSEPNLTITQGQRYQVSFRARATSSCLLTPAFHRPGRPFIQLGGAGNVFASQIKLAADAGVNFVSFPIGLPWPKPGETVDWGDVDTVCQTVLHANPKALLLPRIPMDPPPWWREAHPDDVMQWDDGHREKAVPASPRYRRDAAERLTALIDHLEEKFGDHIAGYHPCGQNTGEWFYQNTWSRSLNGYAPADLAAYRDPVPTPAERRSTNVFASATVVDWARFQQEAMADCVIELARAARKASCGRKLVVFFYGYVFEFAGVHNGAATSGHYALRRVLDCPDIDVLCSPISYFDRGLGGSAPSMTAAESVALAGKMWLNEDDTHTYLATGDPPGWRDHVTTLAESNAELVRNVAQEALRNFGMWWMDLTRTGWFNDPGMWAEMKRLEGLDEYFLKKPTPFRPEVAVVIDEAAMLRVAPGGSRAAKTSIYDARAPLGRMGAPYGQYLLDDVLAGRVQAKLFVFVNGWCFSSGERARLERIARELGHGKSLFVDEKGLTSELLRRAARAAGVHLFTETDCNVYANGRFIALHASQDGPLAVHTGVARPVRDVLTGETVGQGPKFTLPIKRGETRVLGY